METYLAHHGILGMKWGIRRYQNKDGTLTEAGKKRYADSADMYRGEAKKAAKKSRVAAGVGAASAAATIGSAYGFQKEMGKALRSDFNYEVSRNNMIDKYAEASNLAKKPMVFVLL